MSSLIARQPKDTRKQTTISLSTTVLSDLELYCQFIDSARDWVINEALKNVFQRDKAFAEWRRHLSSVTANPGNGAATSESVQGRLALEAEGRIERPRGHRGPTPLPPPAA